MKNTILCSLCVALSASSALASITDFSYGRNGTMDFFGYGKAETYDVAIFIPGESLAGKQVTGLRVAIPEGSALTKASGWLTTELQLKRDNGKYVNNPDICSADGVIESNSLTVTFDTPYTITPDGFYAGYTFTQDDASLEAVATVPGENPDALWIHASRSKLKWGSVASELGRISTLEVIMDGDFSANSASFMIEDEPVISIDGEALLDIAIVNYGLDEIRSIGYTYVTPEGEGNASIELSDPVPPAPGSTGEVTVSLGHLSEVGTVPVSLRLDAVNGMSNDNLSPLVEFNVKSIPFMPENRPLFEEYTGLWCGWCPRGFVALEAMSDMHGERFVGVAYHSGDEMSFLNSFPGSIGGGLPTSYINRGQQLNPGSIYGLWEEYAATIPAADVEGAIAWSDGDGSDVRVSSTVRFIESATGAEYRVGYLLVADGLKQDRWFQSNSYSGLDPDKNPDMPLPWAEVFFEGGGKVPGLTFNDVVIAATDYDGVAGSLPSEIEAGEPYGHSFTFSMDDLKKSGAAGIIGDWGKLRVVAVVMNARNGQFVNCISSLHLDGSSHVSSAVEDIVADTDRDDPVETIWYDLCGRRVSDTGSGLFIRLDVYSDGSVRSTKVMR